MPSSDQERWTQVKEDFWGDLKREQALALSRLLTATMEIQVHDLIGYAHYAHSAQRTNFRNGYRYRPLLTSFGYLSKPAVPVYVQESCSSPALKHTSEGLKTFPFLTHSWQVYLPAG